MGIGRVLDVNLESRAELARVLLESGLEPARAEPAALHPLGCERGHGRGHRPRVEIGRTHDLERPRRPAPLGERGPFQQDGAGEAARHPEVRGVGAGVHPGAFAEWPAESRTSHRRPVLHRDDLALDIEAERAHEPAGELSQREAVTHRQRSSADEALHKTAVTLLGQLIERGRVGSTVMSVKC